MIFYIYFCTGLNRLLDRNQVDDEESVEDDEDDEFLKGFKVLKSSFITTQFMRSFFILLLFIFTVVYIAC